MCQSTMYYSDKMRYSDTVHTTRVFTERIIILYAHMHIYIARDRVMGLSVCLSVSQTVDTRMSIFEQIRKACSFFLQHIIIIK